MFSMHTCVCVCMCVCVCIYTHIYKHTFVCMCEYIYVCMCEYIYVCMCEYIYVCMCEYIYVCMCEHIYVCMYVHKWCPAILPEKSVGRRRNSKHVNCDFTHIPRHICVRTCVLVFTFGNHKSFKRHQLWIEDLLRKNRWCPLRMEGFGTLKTTKKYTLKRHTNKEVRGSQDKSGWQGNKLTLRFDHKIRDQGQGNPYPFSSDSLLVQRYMYVIVVHYVWIIFLVFL